MCLPRAQETFKATARTHSVLAETRHTIPSSRTLAAMLDSHLSPSLLSLYDACDAVAA